MSSLPSNLPLQPTMVPILGIEDMATLDNKLFLSVSPFSTQSNHIDSDSDSNSLPSTPPSISPTNPLIPDQSSYTKLLDNDLQSPAFPLNPTTSPRGPSEAPVKQECISPQGICDSKRTKTGNKVGRKRKSEVVDKEARAKERVIRNRAAAQESRDRKRRYITDLEEANTQLHVENEKLGKKLYAVEQEKLTLSRQLEAITAQLAMFQAQAQMVEMSNFLFDGFGESAVLTKFRHGKRVWNSQQRRPSIYQRNLHKMTSTESMHLSQHNATATMLILLWIFSFGLKVSIISLWRQKISQCDKEVMDIPTLLKLSQEMLEPNVKELHKDWSSSPSLNNQSLWPP
ncbi:hypothetical protein K493DRAFT_291610 [Basidiobolus meristosporus CBS 931.73]|uniref:BZIP domain-containing protein n=1 Tax=Basidiobolus meristosporus CBS 931.73 TaxID=1314790 RepID=A0A1Y1XHR6_9FUNG|nr:hypothetical protein K493DRAFT_291610 [Basidiobolus meristosporus CBS 931.73]|eukprot:ORX85295.1 hypothetical protein K493DRAFT_291610 [Basidiobolus meristosporus CBS 931.73]